MNTRGVGMVICLEQSANYLVLVSANTVATSSSCTSLNTITVHLLMLAYFIQDVVEKL